ncbi:ABC transporter permease [Lutispora thermophila]|uniref:Transport permease protein n=1 Tax=Lutispora thermophila DSM 19022 TaxID=1122184 RepID=A0A1M6I7H0_9FIRM|nr:ABC transporter permease [Lutispora thermophila]SHJ30411.1 ABC-2 type transporter [Lutispora thermophila DSM 19022]
MNPNNINEEYANSYKSAIMKQVYLIRAELLSFRLNWKWSLIIVLITPISMLFFLWFLFKDKPEYLLHVVTGNMVLSLVTGTMLTLGQELGVLKQLRGFDYYATLPIRKINLIIAYLIRATLQTLPSMIVILLLGRFVLHIPISIHYTFILVVLLSGLSLSAAGAFIGIYSKDAGHASILTQVLQPLVVYLAPVFIPVEHMPKLLNIVSYAIPTRYVANALRASCSGTYDLYSLNTLLIFSIISIILIENKMEWRMK